ncbi:MAG TPA: ROK family protein [Planctomycetaceae bacterium]|jgi:glucokinase
MQWYLGIEIGGTKLQIAVGRGQGDPFRALWRGDIDAAQGAARIHQQIISGIDELLAQARIERAMIAGVGIGFGGPVDTARGQVVTSHQVAGWDRFPLVKWFETNLGLPAVLHNDADTAAYAEAHFGAGRGFDPVLYITVGSGIGGGLVCQGRIFRGSGAGAMEIGHLRPGRSGRHVSAAGDSVESIASGFGIEDRARQSIAEWEAASQLVESRFAQSDAKGEVANQGKADEAGAGEPKSAAGSAGRRYPERFATLLKLVDGNRDRITARVIAQAARQGDRLCRALLFDATETLGWAVAQAITLINPGRIVIGGGVSLIGQEQFFEPVREACQAAVFKPFSGIAEIVPAALLEEVVIHGALALARDAFEQEPILKAFAP